MAGPAEPLLSVRAGAAEPATMTLPPGQPIGPLSIGRRGTWRIVAPGVLEEHGFLYFNGTDLFLQSTDPSTPLLADGAPIPLDWTAVYAPCEIGVGGASLWFGSPQGSTTSPPPAGGPAPFRPPAPTPYLDHAVPTGTHALAPRARGNDDEVSTRLQTIEELKAMRASGTRAFRDPAAEAPAFGAPLPSVPAPSFGALPLAGIGAPPPSAGVPPFGPVPVVFPGPPTPPGAPPASPAGESWIGARWREASGPKKALFVLMAPLIWAVWVIFTDKPPAPVAPRPAASAAAAPSATPSAGAPSSSAPADTAAVEPPPPAPSGSASAKAAASAAPSSSPATTGSKTPQREAADAVAAGAFDRAAKLYADLARTHPDVPAYAEAARILKAKAGKR